MAVLLRALGIPARVAVGFTGGAFDRARGVWRVNSGNAHAWVEVPFPGFGWLTFDPTPGRADALAPYNNVQTSYFTNSPVAGDLACQKILAFGGEKSLTSRCSGSGQGAVVPTTAPAGQGGRRGGTEGREGGAGAIKPSSPRETWVLAVLIGLVLLLLLAIPTAKLTRRRLAVRRRADPSARVLAAYRVLEDQAADVGLRRLPAETLLEYRARLKERVTSLDGDLDRLTTLAGKAAYGDADLTIEDVDRAMTSARQVAHDIRASAGRFKRAAGWFRVEIGPRD